MASNLAATALTTTNATPATGIATLIKRPEENYVVWEMSGTYGTVTFIFQGTIDGTNWFAVAANLQTDYSPATGTIAPADNAVSLWFIQAPGLTQVRCSISAIASGTITATAAAYIIPGLPPPPTNVISAYGAQTSTSFASSGKVTSTSPTAGMGYATGAGGAVTQITSRATGVTLNTVCGAITLVSAAGSATPFSFTVTNSAVAATDVIELSQKSGTDKYTTLVVTAVAAGSFQITAANASGTTTESPVFNFYVSKAVVS